MALYKYLAALPGEKTGEVLIEADSEKESLDKLRRRGMVSNILMQLESD